MIIRLVYRECGLGSGIKNLYDKVSRHYLNIKRVDVERFLKKQTDYQLITKPKKITNRGIYSNGVMKTIGIDLLDLTHFTNGNLRYLYMLVGVDYFSKFIFIIPLRAKTNKAVLDGMKKMILDQCGGRYPRSVVADNGGEFKNEMLDAWFAENNIKVIHGPTYSPKSNA